MSNGISDFYLFFKKRRKPYDVLKNTEEILSVMRIFSATFPDNRYR